MQSTLPPKFGHKSPLTILPLDIVACVIGVFCLHGGPQVASIYLHRGCIIQKVFFFAKLKVSLYRRGGGHMFFFFYRAGHFHFLGQPEKSPIPGNPLIFKKKKRSS